MAKIKNLTPHPIHLVDENNNIIRTFESDGLVRLKTTTVDAGQIDGCKVTVTQFGLPEGLPEENISGGCNNCSMLVVYTDYSGGYCGSNKCIDDSVYYVVSQLVKSALPSRKDLLVPAEVVRDEKGNIIGCRSFGI